MTIKLIKEKLSLAKVDQKGVVLEQIENELFKDAMPVIYVTTDKTLTVINTIIFIYGSDNVLENKINMAGKTIIEIVILLNEHGIESYLTKNTVGFLPAENILNFTNKSYVVSWIRETPKSIDTIYGKCLLHAPKADKSYMTHKIISVYQEDTDITYSNDPSSNSKYKYTIENNKIYINRFSNRIKCLTEFRLNTFFLFFQYSQVTETNVLIKNDQHTNSSKILLNSVNSINRDKV